MMFRRMFLYLIVLGGFELSSPGYLVAEDRENSLSASYDDALSNFRQSKFKESARQLKSILQKEPKHKEAALLLGTIYYQHQSQQKAKVYFDRVDASAISAETAFAWGAVYLHYEDYRRATQGFRYVVKNRLAFRAYAIYYLGVAYFRLGQWARARRFFKSSEASELPNSMQTKRKLFLAEIRRQQDKVLDAVIGSNRKTTVGHSLIVEQMDTSRSKEKDKEGTDEDLEASRIDLRPIDKSETARGYVSSWKPSLTLVQQTSYFDNHGLNHDSSTVLAHREALQGTVGYAGSWNSYVQVNAGLIGYDANFQESRFFELEQTTGIFTSQLERNQKLQSSFSHIEFVSSTALKENMSFELSGRYWSLFPGNAGQRGWGQSLVQGQLRYADQDLEASVQLQTQFPFDSQTGESAQDLDLQGELAKELGDFRLQISAHQWTTDNADFVSRDRFRYILADPSIHYRTGNESDLGGAVNIGYNWGESTLMLELGSFSRGFQPANARGRISNLDSIESVAAQGKKIELSYQLPIWETFTVVGSGVFQKLHNVLYISRNQAGERIKDYNADVIQNMFKVGAVVPLTSWLQLNGQYTVTDNQYSGAGVADKEFRRSSPDFIEGSTFLLEMSKVF